MDADSALQGVAWLGPDRPASRRGLLARLQGGGVTRHAQARLAAVPGEATELRDRFFGWLTWQRDLRWTQADLLQVMEELEPRATTALTTYFLARAGLVAAAQVLTERLAVSADLPDSTLESLFFGVEGLPSVQAASALRSVAGALPADPFRLEVLARYGHRGLGEVRPDAIRWSNNPKLFVHLAEQRVSPSESTSAGARSLVATQLRNGDPTRWRQAEAEVNTTRAFFRAADGAWDALIMVMAAAQAWLAAVGIEAVSTAIVAQEADLLFLEFEELKQVATGEWHAGRSGEAQAIIDRRRALLTSASPSLSTSSAPMPVVSGQASGPAYCTGSAHTVPAPDAVWLSESTDPGAAAFWSTAAAVVAASPDAWSPGMIVARALGVPAVSGATEAVNDAKMGKLVTVDAAAGIIRLGPVV
jgi:phosphohistidine swiveling domain-containing protein